MRLLRITLLPFSAVYAIVVFVRNRLYDQGILKSERGALPAIVIGNLATGGTGKTPFTEYILRLLGSERRLAVLSRGYRRQTSGFILANKETDSSQIGDEPCQIHQKFPQIPLAVCEDRLEGISKLKQQTNSEFVVLDDAFQHRRLRPELSILLTDYHRPFWADIVLPAGNLRDNRCEKRRADVIVVTKCPVHLDSSEKNKIRRAIQPGESQLLLFSSLRYGTPYQVSGPEKKIDPEEIIGAFAGLASTNQFEEHLRNSFKEIFFKKFADHHNFSPNDILKLWDEYGKFASALMTTEKDAVKLVNLKGISQVPIFAMPVEMFLHEGEQVFLEKISTATQRRFDS
jgi:tetraacyldisaccharide 4'-kinase